MSYENISDLSLRQPLHFKRIKWKFSDKLCSNHRPLVQWPEGCVKQESSCLRARCEVPSMITESSVWITTWTHWDWGMLLNRKSNTDLWLNYCLVPWHIRVGGLCIPSWINQNSLYFIMQFPKSRIIHSSMGSCQVFSDKSFLHMLQVLWQRNNKVIHVFCNNNMIDILCAQVPHVHVNSLNSSGIFSIT